MIPEKAATAVQKAVEIAALSSRAGRGGFGPPACGEEQGRGQGTGEEPSGKITRWHAVVGSAFRPHPEAQGGGAGVEDGVHPDEEQGRPGDVEDAGSAAPRGRHGPDDERRVGDGKEERDESGDGRSQGVAVEEAAVGEAGRDAEGFDGVGEDGEREQGQRCPAGAEVSEESHDRGKRDQERRHVRAYARAGQVGEADDEEGGQEGQGAGDVSGVGAWRGEAA